MKVSIVTISFNQAAFLERAIRSVVEQDYHDIEYIIVDPGSTDGSRDIIERYADRMARPLLEPDHGPVDGLNRGFAKATGEVCGYLNSDDEYLPGAIGRIVEAFRRNSDADMIYGHGYFIDEEDRVLRRFRSTPFDLRRCAFGGVVVMQQATFFRRAAFEEVGGFDISNRTCWDLELCVDFALRGKRLARIDDYLALFRLHDGSISGSGRLDELYRQDIENIARKILGRSPGHAGLLRKVGLRLDKWLRDPAALMIRLADLVGGTRRPADFGKR